MSAQTWWFLHHNTAKPTPEQTAYNTELVALTNGIYRLEAELARFRKRLAELTGSAAPSEPPTRSST
jgi:hypothetical protein